MEKKDKIKEQIIKKIKEWLRTAWYLAILLFAACFCGFLFIWFLIMIRISSRLFVLWFIG
jgi:hypothetical protein